MRSAKNLLELATQKRPPTSPASHALTLKNDQLSITLFLNDKWLSFGLEDADLDRSVEDVWNDIEKHLGGFL